MKSHLKILGAIYISLGALIAAFILIVLLLGSLNSLGITHGKPDETIGSALVVLVVLGYPTIWIMRTGLALYYRQRSGRLWGMVLAGILMIGLNVILLLTKDQPNNTHPGIVVFHFLLILIGIYGLIVLVPGRVKNFLE
jgi:hypothetical protein